jgi:hypothetical protein
MKLEVASPCSESWDGMAGDDRIRFCGKCRLNVYNLSQMSQPEIDQIFAREGRPPCIRFFARADGTVLTRDCPVGWRRKWFVRAAWAAAALVFVGLLYIILQEHRVDARSVADWVQGWIDQLFPPRRVVMGEAPCPSPPAIR